MTSRPNFQPFWPIWAIFIIVIIIHYSITPLKKPTSGSGGDFGLIVDALDPGFGGSNRGVEHLRSTQSDL